MRIQKVSAGRGAAWVNESIELLKSGGRAIWGPSLLVGVLLSIPYLGNVFGTLSIIFYAGLVLCFDRPTAGNNPFSGFQNGNFERLLLVLGLNLLYIVIALMALKAPLLAFYEIAQQGREPSNAEVLLQLRAMAQPMPWLVPLGIFLSWITQFAVPLASLKKISGIEAIKLALSAIGTNVPALIINFLCLMAVVILTIIVLMIPIALVSAAFAGSPMLANLLVIPLIAVLTAIILALMCGNAVFAYRDVFGEDAAAPAAADSEVLL